MKFVITEGCTAFDTTIDGTSVVSEEFKEREGEILDYILNKLKEKYQENGIQLTDLIRLFPSEFCENDGVVCGSCGDTVTTKIWEI